MSVVKNGFVFPTKYLKARKEDGELIDIYHGEKIIVKEPEVMLAVNIPLDPVTQEQPNKKVLWGQIFRKIQYGIALFGPAISLFSFVIDPGIFSGSLVAFQTLSYLLFLRLARPKKPHGWGVVYDHKTRSPLSRAIVRIFDKKFNKLLETQVTGPNGNYGFFASKNIFFVTVEKNGFQPYHSEDINLKEKQSTVVDKHVPLDKL